MLTKVVVAMQDKTIICYF